MRVPDIARELGRETVFPLLPQNVQAQPEQRDLGQLPGGEQYGEVEVLYDMRRELPFFFLIDGGVDYNSNVALLPENEIGDWLFNQSIHTGWSKPIPELFIIPRVTVRQEWYEYARTDDLLASSVLPDFAVFEASAGVARPLKALPGAVIAVDYSYERLTNLELDDAFYTQHHLLLTGSKGFKVSSTHKAFCGAFADFSLDTDPAASERHEYGGYIGYSIDWTPELSTTALYRLGFYDYQGIGRDDLNHSIQLAVDWKFSELAGIRISAGLVENNSDLDFFDYTTLSAGASIALKLKW